MSPRILLRSSALALCVLAAAAHAAPQAGVPHLRHVTAPFLGQTLTFQVDGAAPNSPITLYFSPESGSYATPYGPLELRRETLAVLERGTTTASGSWSTHQDLSLERCLAEMPAHFQALVDDPSAPAGKLFTDAVHLRFLGPRVYDGHAGGMCIVSGVTDTVVARVDFGATDGSVAIGARWEPVFDATFSRGAVMVSGRELQFFDPFFGALQGRLAFASICSPALLTDSDRRTVYVLETAGGSSPARIHAIDLSSGTETAHLDLPNAAEPIWCSGRGGSEVFVAEHEPGGRTAIRWVGIDPLVDRGSTAVGTSVSNSFIAYDGTSDAVLPFAYAAGQLFVSTCGWSGMYLQGSLSRCIPSASGIGARVTNLGTSILWTLAPVPGGDRLLGGQMYTDWGPAGWMCQVPLHTVGAPTFLPAPPTGSEMYVHDIAADGPVAWIVAEWEWHHSDILYRLDLGTMTWTVTPHAWLSGRNDAEVLRDVWNHEVWVSNEKQLGTLRPGILIVDEEQGTSRHVPFDHFPGMLHAVPLP